MQRTLGSISIKHKKNKKKIQGPENVTTEIELIKDWIGGYHRGSGGRAKGVIGLTCEGMDHN